MASNVYHGALVALARAKHGAQRLAKPQSSVRIDNPLCGDEVTLDLFDDGDIVREIGHRVRGCLLCEAAASWVSLHSVGRPRSEAQEALRAARAMLASGELGSSRWPDLELFLPVHAAKSRHRCVLLPLEALTSAAEQLEQGETHAD